MTDEESQKQQFDKQVRERVEALRKAFAPLTRQIKPSDEPAPVFRPTIYPEQL
jgi:hypothetical protein